MSRSAKPQAGPSTFCPRPSLGASRVGMMVLICVILTAAHVGQAAELFIRVKVKQPTGERCRIRVGGHRHEGPAWTLPERTFEAVPGQWSEWFDLSEYPLHKRLRRAGGLAEWPSLKLTVRNVGSDAEIEGCAMECQLADQPAEDHVVVSFSEHSESDTICFLLPNPIREHADQFETGSQMAKRQLAWAREVAGGTQVDLDHFDICTTLWGHYDPGLARQSLETLKLLGFNVVNGASTPVLRHAGVNVLGKTWDYLVDPEKSAAKWKAFREEKLPARMATPDGRWEYEHMRHLVIADEVKTLKFDKVDKPRRDEWFRAYLRTQDPPCPDLGRPLEQVELPIELFEAKTLPREADLHTRRLAYLAARFGQWWSVKQLRQTSEQVYAALPGMKTETLPASHGFFNAWGPPNLGMSYPLLNLFEIASQQAVDVLSAEDWLGLNHMYGPSYTWTGSQSLAYLGAIMRSAIGERPIKLLGLITPSDDQYLRLKAFSLLGQGSKAFYFWTFGPTYIGSENYWSDLHSEYEGIGRFTRTLDRAEEVLGPARPVSDRVAVLYSVSQDIWYPDQPAAFVEKRLLWHALRHLGVQPDFLCEKDVEAGRLSGYDALFVVDWCISRRASAMMDAWLRKGGIMYLSAGAATYDEFHEPFVPAFAEAIWADAAHPTRQTGHSYNERTDLPDLEPLTSAQVTLGGSAFPLPVLGCRLDLANGAGSRFARFADGSAAGAVVPCGEGQVVAVGFMPMLAYGQLARFQPKTLAEKWPAEPRRIVQEVLERARIRPAARASVPVVETSLLAGPKASALVLVNYTYEPIGSLQVEVNTSARLKSAVSCEHGPVTLERTSTGARVILPLEWADIVLLEHE